MPCQCPGCTKEAEPGGLICQKCRDAIDRGDFDHHNKKLTQVMKKRNSWNKRG
jgi:hypothetical protein